MITRMKIAGFKNIVDLDVRFGPFTCVAGANGVGKSNLFDAIMFLSALADKTLIEAAMSVRGEGGRVADVRHLFHRSGPKYVDKMTFEVEMIIPHQGVDDYGQMAQASITSLRYALCLAYRPDQGNSSTGKLKLIYEELQRIKLGDANKHFLFQLRVATWRKSAVQGRRRSAPFISTDGNGLARVIKMHQDAAGLNQNNAEPAPDGLFQPQPCPARFSPRPQTRLKAPRPCWPAGRCNPGGFYS